VRSRPLPGRLLSCVVVASGSSISNSISGSMSGCRCISCSSRASNSAWFFSLNRPTRSLTIIASSGSFLCHLYSSRCTFACHVSWPRLDIFRRALVFTAVQGSRSSYTSRRMMRQYLYRSEEIVTFRAVLATLMMGTTCGRHAQPPGTPICALYAPLQKRAKRIAPFERLAGREIYSSPGVFLNG
jgi:hypothetical protein